MNVKRKNIDKGAVLVIALIMLSMVTFLVVAFVGFARFERASVTASLKRTEVTFISGESQSVALTRALSSIYVDNEPSFLKVSKRLSNSEFVPVYIDRNGDGMQEVNATYLNLNAEDNLDGQYFQPSSPENFISGDPEWIGILHDPAKQHNELLDPENRNGPRNHFIARVAYMTVPVSEILNVRYNHDYYGNIQPAAYGHRRGQGGSPRSINLAAPLYHMDPGGPLLPSKSYKYAEAMQELGAAVGDAYFYARPSFSFKHAINSNRTAGRQTFPYRAADALYKNVNLIDNDTLNGWFRDPGGGRKPYGYYKFMGTFSAAELPEETGGFDISSIRDERTLGHVYTQHIPEFGGSVFRSLQKHGLKDGDKIEFTGNSPRPGIADPISFNLFSRSKDPNLSDAVKDAELKQNWINLRKGEFSAQVTSPHRLINGESLILVTEGVPKGWRLCFLNINLGKYEPFGGFFDDPKIPDRWPYHLKNYIGYTTVNDYQLKVGGLYHYGRPFGDHIKIAWATESQPGQWEPHLVLDDTEFSPLPEQLRNASCKLVYRWEAKSADIIPYFTKVWDGDTVSLHRSARLDPDSRVRFLTKQNLTPYVTPHPNVVTFRNNVSFDHTFYNGDAFYYNKEAGEFSIAKSLGERYLVTQRFREASSVCFVSPAIYTTEPDGSHGGQVEVDHVFKIHFSREENDRTYFQLKGSGQSSTGGILSLQQSGTYNLRLVYPVKLDLLTASVEKMVGAMLNESLDYTDDNGSVIHPRLGGRALPVQGLTSYPFTMGIGGHHRSLGLWHDVKDGIPWASIDSNSSHYTAEMDRIVQVAANIGDIYSESRHAQIKSKDIIRCWDQNGSYKAFGEAAADGRVSAEIRYRWNGKDLRAGIDYGPYRVFFKPDIDQQFDKNLAAGFVEGTVNLEKSSGVGGSRKTQLIAQSARCTIKVMGPYLYNGGQWEWSLGSLSWKNGYQKSNGLLWWAAMNLSIEMNGGRHVKVYLNNKELINYDSSLRVDPKLGLGNWITSSLDGKPAQGALWVESDAIDSHIYDDAYFTLIHPPMNNVPEYWSNRRLQSGWGLSKTYTLPEGRYPTAYQGVFNSDSNNTKVYLTGLQRKWGLFSEENSYSTSWYQRGAPKVLGVKNHPSYNNRLPAINEISLKCLYRGDNNATPIIKNDHCIKGRIDLEINIPKGLYNYRIDAYDIDLNGRLKITDSNGDQHSKEFKVSPSSRPFYQNNFKYYTDNGLPMISLTEEILLCEINDEVQVGSLRDVSIDSLKLKIKVRIRDNVRIIDFFDGELAMEGEKSLSDSTPNNGQFNPRLVELSWQANDPLVNSKAYNLKYKSYHSKNYPDLGNIGKVNDLSMPWLYDPGKPDSFDYTKRDPAIGFNSWNSWWTFPDASMGGIQNIGWLGQVHRGTPWQTLYLKSKGVLNDSDWMAWAGNSDTKPVNDRRLLEAFYISGGNKLRGRLSVNNPTPEAWSGVLEGLRLPYPSTRWPGVGGANGHYTIKTNLGADDPRWNEGVAGTPGVLGAIANVRGNGRFKRVTDILAAPQLTDESPYLPAIVGAANLREYQANSGKIDELDMERIPQQILSLLKVGGTQRFQSYIFTQQLKPARRYHPYAPAPGPNNDGGPGFDDEGNVFNYEVVSQTAERVLVELIGSAEWHESFKRGHPGKFVQRDGSLVELSPPRWKIISKYPIDMEY